MICVPPPSSFYHPSPFLLSLSPLSLLPCHPLPSASIISVAHAAGRAAEGEWRKTREVEVRVCGLVCRAVEVALSLSARSSTHSVGLPRIVRLTSRNRATYPPIHYLAAVGIEQAIRAITGPCTSEEGAPPPSHQSVSPASSPSLAQSWLLIHPASQVATGFSAESRPKRPQISQLRLHTSSVSG